MKEEKNKETKKGGKGAKQPEERPRRGGMGVGDKKEREREREKGGEGSDLEDLK